jgi:hypothetical protein
MHTKEQTLCSRLVRHFNIEVSSLPILPGTTQMASKIAFNAKNLAALGAGRLAEVLLEIGTTNPAVKRRIRLELAAAESPEKVAQEVRKRLATVARSRSFIDWENRKPFVEDLQTQRRAIVEQVAKTDPAEALELMWHFLSIANRVFDRCDDSSGTVIGIFHGACRDLGEIARTTNAAPETLAERAFGALSENDYGQYDELIRVLSPALGSTGLEKLKKRFIELSKAPAANPKGPNREIIGWSTGGPLYADEIAASRRDSTIRLALQEIADAQGDVDAFIAQHSEKAKTVPRVAAEIAHRLLQAGRTAEAWSAINAVEDKRPGWIPFEWEQVRLDVLQALGRDDEAQAFRWECFERTLSRAHLRDYLKQFPDFEDVEAERRAMSYALKHPSVHQALAFFVSWPALDKAATLITQRLAELNGDHYEILSPAADALAAKYPLAATLVLRAMIDFTLKQARASRYRHAARHLAGCASLASAISDFGAAESHTTYSIRLKKEHGRKNAFWALVS